MATWGARCIAIQRSLYFQPIPVREGDGDRSRPEAAAVEPDFQPIPVREGDGDSRSSNPYQA